MEKHAKAKKNVRLLEADESLADFPAGPKT